MLPSATPNSWFATTRSCGFASDGRSFWYDHIPITNSATVNGTLLIGSSICTRAQAGVGSGYGSQVSELRVRSGASHGARLRHGACAPAEVPQTVPPASPPRACLRRLRSKPRLNRKWFRRSIRPSLPKTPKRSLRRAGITCRNGLAGDSVPGAPGLPSPVASTPAGKLLIRHRKSSRSRRVRERRSPPVLCTWS